MRGPLSLFLCLSYSIVSAARVLAGYSFVAGRADYAFHSWYEMCFVTPVSWVLSPVPTIIYIILGGAASLLPSQFTQASWLRDYLTRVLLADLKGPLHPVNGRHNANFNTAAGAPEIDFVRRTAEEHLEGYRRRVPGSVESSSYLLQLAEQCRQLIQELIFGTIPTTHRIEFYPGTSRALEVALTRVTGRKKIIMSPYEHPTECSVVQWHADQTGSSSQRLQISDEQFALGFEDHLRVVVQCISEALRNADAPVVLLISEVCFSTGMVIPVKRIVEKVREEVPNKGFRTIIDGAHAVGNTRHVLKPSSFEAYVFSAHKWLYSSEPMGALISAKGPVSAYDGWGDNLPNTWSSARAIASFLASLQMFHANRLEFFLERSDVLGEHFRSYPELKERFRRVGEACKDQMPFSNMFSLKPTTDYHWKEPVPSLNSFFRLRRVYPWMLDHESMGTLKPNHTTADPITPWVRISFPYWLDIREVKQLAKTLCRAVMKTET